MWREATTMDQRKKVLAKFFKSVLSEVGILRELIP